MFKCMFHANRHHKKLCFMFFEQVMMVDWGLNEYFEIMLIQFISFIFQEE